MIDTQCHLTVHNVLSFVHQQASLRKKYQCCFVKMTVVLKIITSRAVSFCIKNHLRHKIKASFKLKESPKETFAFA